MISLVEKIDKTDQAAEIAIERLINESATLTVRDRLDLYQLLHIAYGMSLSDIARAIGVTRQAVHGFYRVHKGLEPYVPPQEPPRLPTPRDAAMDAINLASIRECAGLTELDLARNMGKTGGAELKSNIRKTERQTDWKISSLAAYIAACGACAELIVSVGGETLVFQIVK